MDMLFFPVTLQILLDVSHPGYFLHHDNKMPDTTHLKEEGFILADGIRDVIPGRFSMLLGSTVHWRGLEWKPPPLHSAAWRRQVQMGNCKAVP